MDFIIVSFPRSGSTWAANWLTSADTYCAHDPLYQSHFRDFDAVIGEAAAGRVAGIACTGTGWLWPEWVNQHPARKLILRRPVAEVNASLRKIGWPSMPINAEARLSEVEGWHVPYTDLFDTNKAAVIWRYLTTRPFDAARHAQLVQMRVEPKLDRLVTNEAVEAQLLREIA